MKTIVAALFFVLGPVTLWAGEAIFPYSAFGPQAAAYTLIGMEWWQWDSHGDSTDKKYPIKIVVFWGQTQEETTKRHPVDQAKLLDFRYVEYLKAIQHIRSSIKEFKRAGLDASQLEETLTQLKKHKAEQAKQRQGSFNKYRQIC